MTATELITFQRAQRTVADLRTTLLVRGAAPPHIHRGYCLDCGASVELSRDHVCYCGSRSVLPARSARPRRVA